MMSTDVYGLVFANFWLFRFLDLTDRENPEFLYSLYIRTLKIIYINALNYFCRPR
jgi:hypothetical protein